MIFSPLIIERLEEILYYWHCFFTWNQFFNSNLAHFYTITAVAHKMFEGLDVLGLLKEKHVVFNVKWTLDR